MSVERCVIAEIRGEIPVAPAVVATKGDPAFACGGSGDAHREAQRLTATPGITNFARPRMQAEQHVSQGHFIRRSECGIAAQIHAAVHGCVHLVIGMTEQDGPDAAGEIRVAFAIKIPNIRALAAREIGRPGLRIKQMRTLRQQARAA